MLSWMSQFTDFLSSFKEQVMVDKGWRPLSLIRMETPAFHLVFLTHFTNLFVVAHLHAFVFFQKLHLYNTEDKKVIRVCFFI